MKENIKNTKISNELSKNSGNHKRNSENTLTFFVFFI